MAKAKGQVAFVDGLHWMSLPLAARHVGMNRKNLMAHALSGAIRWRPDDLGHPWWFAEPEIAAMRKEHLAARRQLAEKRAVRGPRPKTPAQVEREWRRQAEAAARPERDGPFSAMHLRLTLPRGPDEPQVPKKKEER